MTPKKAKRTSKLWTGKRKRRYIASEWTRKTHKWLAREELENEK